MGEHIPVKTPLLARISQNTVGQIDKTLSDWLTELQPGGRLLPNNVDAMIKYLRDKQIEVIVYGIEKVSDQQFRVTRRALVDIDQPTRFINLMESANGEVRHYDLLIVDRTRT